MPHNRKMASVVVWKTSFIDEKLIAGVRVIDFDGNVRGDSLRGYV
jgi:hypothetical protein